MGQNTNPKPAKTTKNTKHSKLNVKPSNKPQAKLSFKDKHRLDELDKEMPALAAEIQALETALADPKLYAADRAGFDTKSARLATARTELEEAELEWLALEEKREQIERNSS